MLHSRLHTCWVGLKRHALHHGDVGFVCVARGGRVAGESRRGSDAFWMGAQSKECDLAGLVKCQVIATNQGVRHMLEAGQIPRASTAVQGRERALGLCRQANG